MAVTVALIEMLPPKQNQGLLATAIFTGGATPFMCQMYLLIVETSLRR